MSTSIIGVHHYHLRHHKKDDKEVPVESNPQVVAEHAMEAAKGGHIVALHMPDTPDPVMVHPDDDKAAVEAKVAEAMPKPEEDKPEEDNPKAAPPAEAAAAPTPDESSPDAKPDDSPAMPIGRPRRSKGADIPQDE